VEFPVEHLSANSIKTFLRCPRQWQQSYMFQDKGPTNVNLIMGDFAHRILAKILMGGDLDEAVQESWDGVMEEISGREVDWKKMSPDTARNIGLKYVYDYWETTGKFLHPIATEKEINIIIPGVDVPIIGFVDIELQDRIIDVKTTGYMNRSKVSLNPEWKLQAYIYQMYRPVPAEFHVLTRSKTDPIIVPGSTSDELYVAPKNPDDTRNYVRQVFDVMKFYVERFGESPWPGNTIHPWAGKYCQLGENCCTLS